MRMMLDREFARTEPISDETQQTPRTTPFPVAIQGLKQTTRIIYSKQHPTPPPRTLSQTQHVGRVPPAIVYPTNLNHGG